MGTILYVDRNTGAYLKRGSGYNAGTSGGIFSSTYYASSNNGSFRCVYQPANTSALHISYPPLNSSIKGITTAYTGKCNSTAGNTTTVTPGAGVTVTVAPTCTNSVLTFTTTYTPETAPGTQSVTITTRDSGSNIIDQITHSVTNNFYCPTNYVFVPGNDGQGTTDFCVAKYEMKALNSGSLITDGNVAYSAAYVAASRPDGTPWVNISQTNAITECSAASLGTGYSLISNAQWQTIARNIESVNSNWSGGVVGSGGISRGNSDGAISATAVADGFAFAGTNLLMAYTSNAAASTVDTDPYRGTGNSSAQAYLSGKEQSRYHTLTTNEKIWDIGGNGSEWVSDLMSGASLTPTISTSEWYEYTNTTYLPASPTTNRTLFGPANTGYNSDNGMGKIYGGSGGAVARSGHCWTDGAGVFSAHLGLAPSDVSFIIGFRCVFVP
jgi:hypothetical protein